MNSGCDEGSDVGPSLSLVGRVLLRPDPARRVQLRLRLRPPLLLLLSPSFLSVLSAVFFFPPLSSLSMSSTFSMLVSADRRHAFQPQPVLLHRESEKNYGR